MTKEVFAARLERIAHQAPDAHIAIPGQVGEPERKEIKQRKKAAPSVHHRGKAGVWTSLLFGGICGAVAGLVFQEVVGIQIFLNFDWQAEMALIEVDRLRAAAWGVIAAGAALALFTLPTHRRFRKLAGGSAAYMATAIGVNAQEFLALVPPAA